MKPIRFFRLALAIACAACAFASAAPVSAQDTAPRVVTVASGLAHPWSLAFLPDGRMLVTEKAGRLRVVGADGKLSAPVAGVPDVTSAGQGGLFDVLVADDFAATRRIWLAYAEPGSGDDEGRNGLAVGTGVFDAALTQLTGWRVIFRQAPKVVSNGHFGGRLVKARDGTLFVTLGDRQRNSERGKAQDLALGHGKVMRIGLVDGALPRDNPFAGRAGAQGAIWSYGHRNVQGAALHPASGELWVVEHGPQGGDEINRVLPGRNYGWPLVSFGCEYGAPVGNCPPVGGATAREGFEPPLTHWVPISIAPSGMAFYSGDRFPEWRGQLFVGALQGRALWRIALDGNRVVRRDAMLAELGERIRDVREGPDGWLYLLTDHPMGRVLRVER